jgi:methionyl aminopeptidase
VKIGNGAPALSNQFVKLQNNDWLEKQRIAGKVVADTLSLLESLVKERTAKSLIELDKIAEEFIRDNGCEPTFLNYKGFSNSICQSVNRQLVHGVATDYILKDADIISFDLGATFGHKDNGGEAIADAAITVIFGEPKSEEHIKLVVATEDALIKAISSIKIGKHLGVIGNAISKHAKQCDLSVITGYGGHGISSSNNGIGIPHAQPFVSNKDFPDNGIRFQPGMVLAIEPLFTVSRSNETLVLDDKWTVMCKDVAAHFEHTIYIHQDHIEIITHRDNETTPREIYFKDN